MERCEHGRWLCEVCHASDMVAANEDTDEAFIHGVNASPWMWCAQCEADVLVTVEVCAPEGWS